MRAFKPKPVKWLVLGTLTVCGWAGLGVALSTTSAAANGATADSPDTASTFDNLDVLDDSLNGKLAILRVGSEASPNNLLTVFAGLKNKTGHILNLEVETIYKDADGNQVNKGSWIALSLKPHEEKEYRSTSISEQFDPNTFTSHFLIRVRLPIHAAPAHK